jgi:hypothetical protein
MGPSQRINEYIRSVRREPFRWGHHDCLIFSNTAFKLYHGFGYADDWLGRYMNGDNPLLPSKLKQEFKADSFDEAVADKVQEISYTPPKGALVATLRAERWAVGYSLGICVGIKNAFLSRGGVIYLPMDDIEKAWIPR